MNIILQFFVVTSFLSTSFGSVSLEVAKLRRLKSPLKLSQAEGL